MAVGGVGGDCGDSKLLPHLIQTTTTCCLLPMEGRMNAVASVADPRHRWMMTMMLVPSFH